MVTAEIILHSERDILLPVFCCIALIALESLIIDKDWGGIVGRGIYNFLTGEKIPDPPLHIQNKNIRRKK